MDHQKAALDCKEADRAAKAYAERPHKKVTVDHSRTEPFGGPELAAFIIMLFRVENPSGGAEDSWDKQLCRIADSLSGSPGQLRDRIDLIVGMSKDEEIRPLIDRAHNALLEMFTAVHETGDWGECKVLTMRQFLQIARL